MEVSSSSWGYPPKLAGWAIFPWEKKRAENKDDKVPGYPESRKPPDAVINISTIINHY